MNEANAGASYEHRKEEKVMLLLIWAGSGSSRQQKVSLAGHGAPLPVHGGQRERVEREQRASTGATAESARGLGHPLCGRQGRREAVHEGGVASAAWRPRPGHASAIEAFRRTGGG